MRLVLKNGKGLYSETKVLEILEGLLMHEPLMYNRVLRLQAMGHQAQQIRKLRKAIEDLKKELAKHGVQVWNNKVLEKEPESQGEESTDAC